MGYSPNNPLVPGDPYSYDLRWMVEQIKAWKDPLDSAERAEASAEAAAISAAEAQAAAGALDQPFVTPEMFGAVGDGITDDKAAFTAAIASGKPVYCHGEKTYAVCVTIGDTSEISLLSGSILNLNGATLQILNPSDLTTYEIVAITGKDRCLICNGIIKGDRTTHSGSTGEHGMGISIFESARVFVKDIYISDCWGDGIYIGGTYASSEHIVIDNAHCYNNRRNGLSLVNGNDVKIINSTFEDTNGTAPEFGIDVETNSATDQIKNVIIANCNFINNTKGAVNVYVHSANASVNIQDIIADGEISVVFLADNSSAVVTNVITTPKNAQAAFVAGSYGNSSVQIANASVNEAASIECVLRYAYNQPHNNISCEAYVYNGTIARITLAYDSSTQFNCHNIFNFKNVTVGTLNNVVPNHQESTNSGEVIGSFTASGNVIGGMFTEIIFPANFSPTNVNLWYLTASDHWHVIRNTDTNLHRLISQTFRSILSNTTFSQVDMPPGSACFYKYIPTLNEVIYYLIS